MSQLTTCPSRVFYAWYLRCLACCVVAMSSERAHTHHTYTPMQKSAAGLVKSNSPSHRDDRVYDQYTNENVPANLSQCKQKVHQCCKPQLSGRPAFQGFFGEMIRHCLGSAPNNAPGLQLQRLSTEYTCSWMRAASGTPRASPSQSEHE